MRASFPYEKLNALLTCRRNIHLLICFVSVRIHPRAYIPHKEINPLIRQIYTTKTNIIFTLKHVTCQQLFCFENTV